MAHPPEVFGVVCRTNASVDTPAGVGGAASQSLGGEVGTKAAWVAQSAG